MPQVRARTRGNPQSEPTVETTEAPQSELANVIYQISKVHGTHVMRRASERAQFQHIPTGIFTLDMATFGGVPQSLITSVYGWESSGKTTVATRCIGSAQRKYPDKTAVFLDIEGTFDPTWAQRHGVDIDQLVLSQPDCGEDALDIAVEVIRASDTSIIVVDSLAMLIPVKEQESSTEDALPGIQARMIGKFCRKIVSAMIAERKRQHYPAIILLNQWRKKIGVFRGDDRVLPGGFAQNFAASVKCEISNREKLGKDDREQEVVDHNEHAFKIHKNKIGNGPRTGEFQMIRNPDHPLGAGFIDDAKTALTYAKKIGLVTGAGASWRIDGVDYRFGKIAEMVSYLYAQPEFYSQFKTRLISQHRANMGLVTTGWL